MVGYLAPDAVVGALRALLRSKSYVAALPDPEAFLAAERASMGAAFPDGRVVEPFRVFRLLARS